MFNRAIELRPKDGKVTEAEFLNAIRSNEKMTSLLTLKVVEIFDSGSK